METIKIGWVFVILFVAVTIAVIFDAAGAHSQEMSTVLPRETPPATGPDFSKYGITDYDAILSLEASELELRRRANERYDDDRWVTPNADYGTGKIGRYRREDPPPKIPTAESSLIVVGKVIGLKSFLSNTKTGIYTEFSIKVNQVVKSDVSARIEQGSLITTDRAGGVVRYPTGYMVLYEDGVKGLPEVGREYLFFLVDDKKSKNYAILTLYELQETKTIPLDSGRNFDDVKPMGKTALVNAVRQKLAQPIADDKSGRKP